MCIQSPSIVIPQCSYCRTANHPDFYGHDKFHCWRIAGLKPCKFCGARGFQNHTESHCPNRPRIMLPRKMSCQSSATDSAGSGQIG